MCVCVCACVMHKPFEMSITTIRIINGLFSNLKCSTYERFVCLFQLPLFQSILIFERLAGVQFKIKMNKTMNNCLRQENRNNVSDYAQICQNTKVRVFKISSNICRQILQMPNVVLYAILYLPFLPRNFGRTSQTKLVLKFQLLYVS